jgi:uncharacterized protein YecT (DUF1311 family)
MFKFFISLLLTGLSLATAKTELESWEGTYNLEPGETSSELKITCKNKTCSFELVGATGTHTCEAGGTFTILNDNISATQDQNSEEKDVCLTQFIQKPNGILKVNALTDGKCQVSCGAGAHYDGDYLREGNKKKFNPSFNCQKATSEIEKAICTDKLLTEGDLLLSAEYAKIQKNSALKDAAKASQKVWLEKRNVECRADRLKECLLQKYRERISELAQLPTETKNPGPRNTHDWLFKKIKFTKDQIPNGFLVNSSIYLGYGDSVLEKLESYRLDYSSEKKTDSLYSIEGWVLGMGSLRALIAIDSKFVWVAFKNKDNNVKNRPTFEAPVGASKSGAPELLKKWIQE